MEWKWSSTFILLLSLFVSLDFVESKAVTVNEEGEPIRLLSTVRNVRKANKRMVHLARLFDSVVRRAVKRPLHWIFLIQPEDVSVVEVLVRRIIVSQAKVPIQIEYVNLDLVSIRFESLINVSRKYFLNTNPLNSSRYYDEVFHIGLVYHLIFPFRRLIALDLDLKFVVDVADLADQFDRMSTTNMIGVANDLAPHYWYDFRHFRRRNPGTPVGEVRPGLQGFNTGVLLLELERMRRNEVYHRYLFDEEQLQALCARYEFKGTLAYQDVFTLIGMEHPELFFHLDCVWNRQLDDTALIDEKFTAIFEPFHRCDGPIRVYHANGGSVMPEIEEVVTEKNSSFVNSGINDEKGRIK